MRKIPECPDDIFNEDIQMEEELDILLDDEDDELVDSVINNSEPGIFDAEIDLTEEEGDEDDEE